MSLLRVFFTLALLAAPAFADGGEMMTCARAKTLITAAPGIESNAILSILVRDWQQMDLQTVASGHPAIEPTMVQANAFQQVTNQCGLNPGEKLGAAAAQVYISDREQIDGY
jgi:hypothetical protein